MTSAVVDASVAVKWCLPLADEDFVLQAQELLASYRSGEEKFLVPDLFWPELANALWKAVRKQRIDRVRAERSLSLVRDLEMSTISSFDLVPETLQLAVKHDRTAYDSLYVVLALQTKSTLITAETINR